MTVGELRALVAELPDEASVRVTADDGCLIKADFVVHPVERVEWKMTFEPYLDIMIGM